ncbi:MAG: AAA family ATPase [Ktedonobacterales bacterium]|nr:AAA family ATPase [Ktedonobacterales bacterium]
MPPRLSLLCGLPGAGKTTLARRMESELGVMRLCPDEWLIDLGITLWDEATRGRLEQRLTLLALSLLQRGQSVVLEYGFWWRSERDQKRAEAHASGAEIALYYLNPPPEELWHRLNARNQAGQPGNVTIRRDVLEEWKTLFQAPDAAEFALFDKASEVVDPRLHPL